MKKLNLTDRVKLAILEFIDYDNKHHCFRWFTLGFSVCTLLINTIILIKVF